MNFLNPYSKYGLALVMLKEQISDIDKITSNMLIKYLEDGLSHFRISSKNDPLHDDELIFDYIPLKRMINESINQIKSKPQKGIYLSPNIISDDLKSNNSWNTIYNLINKLKNNPNILESSETYTMGIVPMAGELNNGSKTKSNGKTLFREVACCAITNTTYLKPYFGFKASKEDAPISTTVIPDLEIDEMKVFIELYARLIDTTIDQRKLLHKKVFHKADKKTSFSRPPIYSGNFPYAPKNSTFGVVGLLGAIGRWAKEAGYSEKGNKVLESLKERPLYIIQYGKAQSVTINHYIIDLAKDNKLSDIVFAIQKSKLIHPFDKNDPKDKKGIESRENAFNLFSSRFLELFNKSTFKDFLSIRAEYKSELLELFNTFFMRQMNIRKEIVQSVRSLGLWLNHVAYLGGQQEAKAQKKPDKVFEYKAKCLVNLESTVFGARNPSDILNVIVVAGRISGRDAPAESDVFKEAVLTGEIGIDEAKSMLMAYARTRSSYESKDDDKTNSNLANNDQEGDPDAAE